ncbi:RNase H family protein [Pseudomonas sp. Marseille-Q7302]
MYRIHVAGACRHNHNALLAYAGLGTVLINPQGDAMEIALQINEKGLETPTNNRAVLHAMVAAMEVRKGKPRSVITIYSNNELTVTSATTRLSDWKANGWKKGNGKAVANIDLWQALDEHLQHHEVSFEHLRGRSSCPAFERAVWLAQQGSEGRTIRDIHRVSGGA